MTMLDAALAVLRKTNSPLSAEEIYSQIQKEKLFTLMQKTPFPY